MNLTVPWTASKDLPGAANGAAAALDQLKQSASEEVDKLADVAADVAAGDPIGKLGDFFRSLLAAIAALVGTLGATGRAQAADLATDLRKVRITTEPQERGSSILPGIALLAFGLTTGGALMYFFDPELGRRRREALRDRLTGTRQDFTDRLQGVMATGQEAADDARESLEERIEVG